MNEYHWGNFRGDTAALVEEYYDAFLHLANWGTRLLMLRFPVALLDPRSRSRYCVGDRCRLVVVRGDVIVCATSEDEEGDDVDWDGEGVLSSILPVRAEIWPATCGRCT